LKVESFLLGQIIVKSSALGGILLKEEEASL